MKKVLLVLVALVLVVSGVAMVSAYEAHIVNVRAHVENALSVATENIHFGTVFPEEWLTKEIWLYYSESFCYPEQQRVNVIDYEVWVVRKPVPQDPRPDPYPDPVDNISGKDYYYWLGDALYIGIFDTWPADEAEKYPEGAPGQPEGKLVHVTTDTAPVVSDNLSKHINGFNAPEDNFDLIVVGLDVPVFEGSYNPCTDPTPKPSGLNGPTVNLTGERNVQGIELGAEVKIQVTDIYRW